MTLTSRILDLFGRAQGRMGLSEGEIAELATLLAESGTIRKTDARAADIASTGGPSSLSTLVCPLLLVTYGMIVPKVGVVGRPAGGIDTLARIPDYKWSLDRVEFERVLTEAAYAHTVANETWAPADGDLFAKRQDEGAQAIPALVVASILSKKLSAGVRYAGLEVRVAPHGNFGATFDDAATHARVYCDVAKDVGLTPVAFVTDAVQPYQPFIGRSEALLGLLDMLAGSQSAWLAQHFDECRVMARATAELSGAVPVPESVAVEAAFLRNVVAQGGSVDKLLKDLALVRKESRVTVKAPASGFVQYSLSGIRAVLDDLNRRTADSVNPYPDDFGIELCVPPGVRVCRGEALLHLRTRVPLPIAVDTLSALFQMEHEPSNRREMEIVQ